MASLRKRGRLWYFRFVDADGVERERKGCTDKRATVELARAAESEAAKIRAGVTDPKAIAYGVQESRALADHLADFRKALEDKGGTRKHAMVTAHRAERILALAKARRLSDLSLSKALYALATLRDEGLGAETINHHVRAVKAFSRWLWRDGRSREHALAHLSTSNPEADRRRCRRALTPEEATRLILAAESGPAVKGMTGPDRAMAFRVAMGTGFRASELASLTQESFRLDAEPPTVDCEAAYTQNGRAAEQPIPQALAALLQPWVASRAARLPRLRPARPHGGDDPPRPGGRRDPGGDRHGSDRLPCPPRHLRIAPRLLGRLGQDVPDAGAALHPESHHRDLRQGIAA